MDCVYVTNKGDAEHTDSYAGVSYKFPAKRTVEVPRVVAIECLGYGHKNKEAFVIRLGWSTTANDMPAGLARLEALEVTEFHPAQNRSLPSAVGEVTPFSETGRGRKSLRVA